MAKRTAKGKQPWETIATAAARYTLSHGLPLDPEHVLHLQKWINTVPREFEKDIAMMFTPRPTKRAAIMERIRGLIKREENGCTHPREFGQAMRNDGAAVWTESIEGINKLTALT